MLSDAQYLAVDRATICAVELETPGVMLDLSIPISQGEVESREDFGRHGGELPERGASRFP